MKDLTKRDWVKTEERLSWMLQSPKKTWIIDRKINKPENKNANN